MVGVKSCFGVNSFYDKDNACVNYFLDMYIACSAMKTLKSDNNTYDYKNIDRVKINIFYKY